MSILIITDFLLSEPNNTNANQNIDSTVPEGVDGNERHALLDSIASFSKGKLKRCDTIDNSAPKI